MRAYIVDTDPGRRAAVSRTFLDQGWHAEIFESAEEFAIFGADEGFVLAYDRPGPRSAIEKMECWKGKRGHLPVVLYSDRLDLEHVIKAIVAGAIDYLQWPISAQQVDRFVQNISTRAEVRRREELVRFEAGQLVNSLSPREREVLTLVTRGHSNNSIAKDLGISPRTVEIHRASAFKKINAGSTADAVRTGVYAGLDMED
ncbi:response regulator transcription factor [Aurantiacibacter hainanensis]|uniref:response regulator transcription factor n=1 Tax=Aurantiacibacter hainanensis TaxID=3076114 RepID=UPI0030C78091